MIEKVIEEFKREIEKERALADLLAAALNDLHWDELTAQQGAALWAWKAARNDGK